MLKNCEDFLLSFTFECNFFFFFFFGVCAERNAIILDLICILPSSEGYIHLKGIQHIKDKFRTCS